MNVKIIALLVSLLAVGASASFAASACCSPSAGGDKTSAETKPANPARLALASYERMSNALANDDLRSAQEAARTFSVAWQILCEAPEVAEKMEECGEHLQAFLKETEIDAAREKFKLVSAEIIKLAEKEEGYIVMTCPMAGEKADWVQSSQEVRNPYHGARMLRCGGPKAKQEAAASSQRTEG